MAQSKRSIARGRMVKYLELFRNNVIVQYTVTTFVLILFVTIVLAQILSRQVAHDVIQSHLKVFPELVRITLKQHPDAVQWLKATPGEKLPKDVEEFFTALLEIPGVFRIKVWNEQGTVIWSDKKELIGKNFAGNPLLDQALKGEVAYGKKKANKKENITEQGARVVLEVYSPVIHEGRVIGAVELYETDVDLEHSLAEARKTVWSVTATAGLSLYLLLFAIYSKAHVRNRRAFLQLIETQDVTIKALAFQSEMHDMETGNHIESTTSYVRLLAEELRHGERDRRLLNGKFIADLTKSAPLHDIGKVGVPDAVLCKPGRFEPHEYEIMKKHSEYGASILKRAEEKLSFESFLATAIEMAQSHHERWDGKGYPDGLRGEEIPLAARIMAVADNYDALRTQRRYKDAFTHDETIAIITTESGAAFDPVVVEAFLRIAEKVKEVSRQFAV